MQVGTAPWKRLPGADGNDQSRAIVSALAFMPQSKGNNYARSLFERLQEAVPEATVRLTYQYRMHPRLAAFPSHAFYDAQLFTPPTVGRDAGGLNVSGIAWLDVPQGRAVKEGTSWKNAAEATVVANLVSLLIASSSALTVRRGLCRRQRLGQS